MSQIAFIFPGQGSQYVGMGQDFYQSDPKARDLCHWPKRPPACP